MAAVLADACGFGNPDASARSIETLKFMGEAIITDVATFRKELLS